MTRVRSAFYDFEPPEIAAILTLRSDIMSQIIEIVRAKGWTQAEAAKMCGTTQPRISALMNGKFNDFSLDALVKIAGHLDLDIDISLSERDAA